MATQLPTVDELEQNKPYQYEPPKPSLLNVLFPITGLRTGAQEIRKITEEAPPEHIVPQIQEKIGTFGMEHPNISRFLEGVTAPSRGIAEITTGFDAPERLIAPPLSEKDTTLNHITELTGHIIGSIPFLAASSGIAAASGIGATAATTATRLGAGKYASLMGRLAQEAGMGSVFGTLTGEGDLDERLATAKETGISFLPFALMTGRNRFANALRVAMGSLTVQAIRNKDVTSEDIHNAIATGVLVGLTAKGGKIKEADFARQKSLEVARDTLKVSKKATQEEIKFAYRELAKKNHPDLGGDPAMMAEINTAYTVLTNNAAPKVIVDPSGKIRYVWSEIKGTVLPVFEGFRDVSTKIVDSLKGKRTVSKQFVTDLVKKPDVRKAEADLMKVVVDQYAGKKIPVTEFANKVKSELLPLESLDTVDPKVLEMSQGFSAVDVGAMYPDIVLSPDVRGEVAHYTERIYESPIITNIGGVHFSRLYNRMDAGPSVPWYGRDDRYFAHTRIEDMTDGITRRLIEVQSDLFQKDRYKDVIPDTQLSSTRFLHVIENIDLPASELVNVAGFKVSERASLKKWLGEEFLDEHINQYRGDPKAVRNKLEEIYDILGEDPILKDVNKLGSFRNTWYERIIREEIKRAAVSGKQKLLLPTGKTAMEIEGLGVGATWRNADGEDITSVDVGQIIYDGNFAAHNEWLVIKLLDPGRFKAVRMERAVEDYLEFYDDVGKSPSIDDLVDHYNQPEADIYSETFDISGRIDKKSPIYRFYEKVIPKFLRRIKPEKGAFDGTRKITDERGVTWWEVPVSDKDKINPIEAFGAFYGFEEDEDGNVVFNPEKALVGFIGSLALKRKGKFIRISGPQLETMTHISRKELMTPGAFSEIGSLVARILNVPFKGTDEEKVKLVHKAMAELREEAGKGNLVPVQVVKDGKVQEVSPTGITTSDTELPVPVGNLPPVEFDAEGAQVAIETMEDQLLDDMLQGNADAIGEVSRAIDAIVKEGKTAGIDVRRTPLNVLREKADFLTDEMERELIGKDYDKYGIYAKEVRRFVGVIRSRGEKTSKQGELFREHIPVENGQMSSDEVANALGMSERDFMDEVVELANREVVRPERTADPFLREDLIRKFDDLRAKRDKQSTDVSGKLRKSTDTPVDVIVRQGPDMSKYANGRYFFAREKYTHKDTANAEWFSDNIPLTRMGNKRGMIGYILNGLGVEQKDIAKLTSVPESMEIQRVHDLFGGSGFLSVLSHRLFPNASYTLNEFDESVISYYRQIKQDPRRVADWVQVIHDYVKRNPGNVEWRKELKLLRPDFQDDPAYLAAEFIVSYNDSISRGRGVSDEEFRRIVRSIMNFSSQIQDVKLTHGDALAVLDHYIEQGTPQDFLWIDPPYLWSTGYGVGTDMEKAKGFSELLDKLDKLNDRGVKFMFFNNEPESRAAKVDEAQIRNLPDLIEKIDSLSKGMVVVRNISPLGAQNREELMITNYLAPENNTALRPINSLQDLLQYELSTKGELPEDTKVFMAEATDRTLAKLYKKEKLLEEREFARLMREADKVMFSDVGARSTTKAINDAMKAMKGATDDAVRDRLANEAGDVNILDWGRTPENVFRRIGMGDHFDRLRKGTEAYEKDVAETFTEFNDWYGSVKGIKGHEERIFDWLDGNKEVQLSAPEMNVAINIANWYRDMADRLGLEEERRITNYATHIFEDELGRHSLPPEIFGALEYGAPSGTFNPFLEERIGASGYKRDVWASVEAYALRGLRQIHLDQPIKNMGKFVYALPQGAQDFTKEFLDKLVGRPGRLERVLDNTIRNLAVHVPHDDTRNWFASRPTRKVFGAINMQIYRGALGLNAASALRNTTQVINTITEEGVEATLVGYASLLHPQRWSEADAENLMSDIVSAEFRSRPLRNTLQKIDKGLFVLFDAAERINRTSNYFAAKYNAKKKGLPEDQWSEYAKQQVRKTQFSYLPVDIPLFMRDPVTKSMVQFSTFPIKQAEFVGGTLKNKEWLKLLRYILSNIIIVIMFGELLGLELRDMFVRNVMPGLGPVPDALRSLGTMATSKYEPERQEALDDIMRSKNLLIPGGVAISRGLRGERAAREGRLPGKKRVYYYPESDVDYFKAILFGTRVLERGVAGSSAQLNQLPDVEGGGGIIALPDL